MPFRTDLALESTDKLDFSSLQGIKQKINKISGLTVTEIKVEDGKIAKQIGKPVGTYVTVEFLSLSKEYDNLDEKIETVAKEIQKLVQNDGLKFVVGLGNSSITPDALGPKVIESIFATRHIKNNANNSVNLPNLKPVAALAPGVLGQTGIEVSEIICSICKDIKPSTILVIDALAARELYRLGSTIQISDTGILPGSGVGNKRSAINKETMGVPVISIGVPTVVDGLTLVKSITDNHENIEKINNFKPRLNKDVKSMIVTPREIDILIERAANIIAMAINLALQPYYSLEDLKFLVS